MIKNLMTIAGALEIIMGLMHFVMPIYAYQSPGFSNLNQNELGFVTVLIFAVGIVLVAFGILTLYFSRRINDFPKVVLFYLSVKTILWLGRTLLEVIYPVNIKLFGLEPFTYVALPGVTIGFLLFLVSAFVLKRQLSLKLDNT